MKIILLILISGLISINAHARLSKDNQSWNTLAFKGKIEKYRFQVETELRYSEEIEDTFEEHIKPYIGYKTDVGEFGVVHSYLADKGFTEVLEKRYALQFKRELYRNFYFSHATRLRYEFRDFTGQSSIAHRTRVLNKFKLNSLKFYKWIPYFSSEFNFYMNDGRKNPQGFSSHRTIAGVSRKFKSFSVNVNYINNYKQKNENSSLRHVFGFGLSFFI